MAKTLLGISPGTRVMGLAVMRKGELIEWRVKSFKEAWCNDKQQMILTTVEKMCEYYGVQTISLKKVDPLKSSPHLDRLVNGILKFARRKRIKVIRYSLSDLDYGDLPKKSRNRKFLSEKIVSKYPELKQEYLRERNNRAEYYTRMFEAIAMVEKCEY